MISFIKKNYFYFVALIIFIIAAYVYCSPVLKGKKLYAGDNITGTAAVQECKKYHETTGDYSWWTGSMFCGMPNYQIGGNHYRSSDLLKPVTWIHRGHGSPVAMIITYLICFFILMRSMNIKRWLSIVGAFAVTLSSYFIVILVAGHWGKGYTVACMAVVLAGFNYIFQKRYGLGVILTLIFTSVGYATHPQMAYYLFMMIGVFVIVQLYQHIKEKRLWDFVIAVVFFVLSVVVGLGTGASNVFANMEYTEQTMRGGHSDLTKGKDANDKTKGLDLDYATQWSYGIDESMTFLIPGFMGGASGMPVGENSEVYKELINHGVSTIDAKNFCKQVPMYWGNQPFTSGNVYMGAVICFLFVLGLFIVKGPYKWALLISTCFSILLSWGNNFMWFTKLFFDYFPLYNKFRAVSSILVVAEVAMPLLSIMALNEVVKGNVEKGRLKKYIYISGGVTAGISLFFALFGGAMFDFTSVYDDGFKSNLPDWLYDAIVVERASLLSSDAWRSVIFIVVAAGALLLYLSKKIRVGWSIAAIAFLIVVDMWSVDKRYMNDSNFVSAKEFDRTFVIQPYEENILKDQDPHFRVFNLTSNPFSDAGTSYYFKSIGGYHAAKLRRYQDVIDEHLIPMHWNVINMLNPKYIIFRSQQGEIMSQVNPDAMGNAWFVDSLLVVSGANQESDTLNKVDLHRIAVVDTSFLSFVSTTSPAHHETDSVRLTKYTPRYIDYEYTAAEDATIVFSEVYYPYGWKATIDDKPVEHYRANYILRALNVPAGSHRIHFEFDPDAIHKGDLVATIFIVIMYASILFIVCFYGIRWNRKRKQIITENHIATNHKKSKN